MSRKTIKVVIPENAEELIDLSKLIYQKHVLDAGTGPLNGLNMTDFDMKTQSANTFHLQSEQLHRDAVTATQNRDLALGLSEGQTSMQPGTVDFYVRSIVDVLLGHFRGNEQKLGDYGFTVVEGTASTKSKPAEPTPAPGPTPGPVPPPAPTDPV